MAKIYVFDMNAYKNNKKELEEILSSNILNIAKKYKLEKDYIRSLIGWYLLKKYLKEDFSMNLNEENIYFNDYGKPYIQRNISFNISHSLNYIAIIISNKYCGIDIEVCNSNRNWDKIKNYILSDKERENELESDDIAKMWTIKEAYFKKVGSGILLSKLKENINYKSVNTIQLYDSLNNKYYLSYIADDEEYIINKVNYL